MAPESEPPRSWARLIPVVKRSRQPVKANLPKDLLIFILLFFDKR